MFKAHLLTGSALALLASTAFAQTHTTLTPVSVVAAPPGSLTVPALSQQREDLFKTAGSVGFVDSESFAQRYANNLRDVLQDSPGVFVQTRYGQELRLSVRGSGLGRDFHTRGIEILQDGIPTNLADGIGDFYQIDPLGLRSAEIHKGGNALPFGSMTLGGAINFVTPTAHTAIAPNIVRFDAGSFGTARVSAQVSRVMGDVDFLINGTLSHADGYRQHMTQKYAQFNANIGFRINPDVETRFYAGIYVTDQKLPGTVTLNQALTNPRQASADAVSGNQARNVRTERLANRTSIRLESGRLDFDTWLIHQTLFHPIFMVLDYDGYTYGFAPRYTGSFDLAGLRDEIVIGGRIYGGNNRARWFFNSRGSRSSQTLNARQDAWNAEAYVENRLFVLPTVALVGGAKLFHANRDYTDFGGLPLSSGPIYSRKTRDFDGIVPKVGVLWEPKKDVQVFANLSGSRDVPDFLDLTQFQPGGGSGFVPLKTQSAYTLELGTRGRQDRFAWDITAYRSHVDGQLLQYSVGSSVPASTFNAGTTILQGVELGASIDLARGAFAADDRLVLRQLWNYSHFHFQNDRRYGNNSLAGIPEHVFRTTLSYTHPSGFYIAPSLDIVPTCAFVDYANTQRVPNYILLGLQAGIDFANGLSVFMDARNLTDKRYISDFGPVTRYSASGTQTFYPGDGRSVYFGARMAF